MTRRIDLASAALALALFAVVLGEASAAPPASPPAGPPASSPVAPPVTEPAPAEKDLEPAAKARAAFERGTQLVTRAKWAEALAAFEEAQQILPHAITLFNIGACERALGRYTAARETLERAMVEHRSGRTTLPEKLVEDARGFALEIEGLLAQVEIRIAPADAALAVDGRAVSPAASSTPEAPRLVAGIRPPGKGERLPAARFVLELDPGRHVLVFSRAGSPDAVVAKDFPSGRNAPLDLRLEDLPATLVVQAEPAGAIVTIDGKDFGPAPISLLRPAGRYDVVVEKDGFITAEAKLTLKAGDLTRYRATLPVDEPSVLETWWFWTVAGVAVSGIAVGTYFLARTEPEPQRATVGGGTLGWRVPVP